MANYRQIHVSIWKDEWFLDLDPSEKLLFIYLFSNEATSLAGIYKLPLKVVIFETGLDRQLIEDTLCKFSLAGKVFYENGIVWVVKMRRYHETSSIRVQQRISHDIALIPNCPLKIRYVQGMHTSPQLKEEENKEENKEEYTEEEQRNFASAVPVIFNSSNHQSQKAERLYQRITGQITIPSKYSDKALHDLSIVLDYYKGADPPMEEGKAIFARWCSTVGQNGKPYSKLNPGWIGWWLEELAPVPVAVRVKETKDMTSAEFHEYLLGKDAQHDS